MSDGAGRIDVPFEPRPLWTGALLGLTVGAGIIAAVETWAALTRIYARSQHRG